MARKVREFSQRPGKSANLGRNWGGKRAEKRGRQEKRTSSSRGASPIRSEFAPRHSFPYAARAQSCGARVREPIGASFARIERSVGIFPIDGWRIEVIMKSSGRRGRRALGSIPKLAVAHDSFDDGEVIDEADDLERAVAAGTEQRVGFKNLLNQARPGAPGAAGAFILRFGGPNGLAGYGAGLSHAGAAYVRPLAVVSVNCWPASGMWVHKAARNSRAGAVADAEESGAAPRS